MDPQFVTIAAIITAVVTSIFTSVESRHKSRHDEMVHDIEYYRDLLHKQEETSEHLRKKNQKLETQNAKLDLKVDDLENRLAVVQKRGNINDKPNRKPKA